VTSPLGEPHPGTTEPGVFTGTDPGADVGEPGDLGAQIGTPHDVTDLAEPDDFVGTDPDADVGKPNGVT
jgi:hypothetical protein